MIHAVIGRLAFRADPTRAYRPRGSRRRARHAGDRAGRPRPAGACRRRDAHRHHRGPAAGEGRQARAVRAQQGRAVGEEGRGDVPHRQHEVAPVLHQRVRRRRIHARCRLPRARARLRHARRARQLHLQQLQADREPSTSRRGCSTAAPGSRSSAAGARRRRSTSSASATTATRMRGPITGSGSRTWRGCSRCGRRAGALFLAGGAEFSQWDQFPGEGDTPTVGDVYGDVNGLDAKVTYLHTQGTVAIDTRLSPEYARRGGYYGVTHPPLRRPGRRLHVRPGELRGDPAHPDPPGRLGAVAARPRRDDDARWRRRGAVLHAARPRAAARTLRGYQNLRFRDRHSLLMQAEWRVLVNSFIDTAIFFDAGKVAARKSDLDFNDLHTDFGIGFRLHGPLATPLRIELAKGSEGFNLVFARERQLLRSRIMQHRHLISSRLTRNAAAALVVAGLLAARRAPRARRRPGSTPTTRSSASPRARTPRAPPSGTSTCSTTSRYQLFVTAGKKPHQHARGQHQHRRRGAGLELVHQPHRQPADHGRGTPARSRRGTGARAAEMDADAREERGHGRRASRPRMPTARRGSCPSTPRPIRAARPPRS